MITTRFPIFRAASAGLLLALAFSPALRAAEEKQSHSLGEKTSEAFKNLKPLLDAKDYDGILKLLDSVQGTVSPTSYDMALIMDTKSKIFMSKEQLARAIEPAETALKLSDQFGYFDEATSLAMTNLLARLIYAEAINIKDKNIQQQYITKAAGYLKRFLQKSKKPTPDDQMFYAQLLFAQGTNDPNKVNEAMLKEARTVIEDGMAQQINPKEGFYQLLLALIQQENDYAHSAELLELTIAKFPGKSTYWPLLMSSYLQLATAQKDPMQQREYYVRAINTIERAQAQGQMVDPKNNYNLVTIYIAAGQFSKATDLLHAGLRKGTIESTLANWRILGSYYQQANKELQAIDALKEAQKLYPNEGMIDLHIGEIYRGMEKTAEAREFYRGAIKKKATLERPHVAYQLLAFAAMEVDDWDEALAAINEASKYPEFQKDKQMINLKKHIEETVAERENAKKEKEEKEKAKTNAAKKD